jgi:hypothetical protein
MAQIKLSKSKEFAIVDADDIEKLPKCPWRLNAYGYVVGYIKISKYVYSQPFIHRVIINCPHGFAIDHINGDKLDNRKCNLRIVTAQQNKMNSSVYKNNKSGFKGVNLEGRKYRATIKLNGKKMHIGLFETPEQAAKAYDEIAKNIFGEYARLNY